MAYADFEIIPWIGRKIINAKVPIKGKDALKLLVAEGIKKLLKSNKIESKNSGRGTLGRIKSIACNGLDITNLMETSRQPLMPSIWMKILRQRNLL